MEFPLVPWLGSMLYRAFGYHEPLLRIPSAILGLVSLLVFMDLSRRALPPAGALFATTAFALNPLLVYLGNAMQPDPLMLFLSLVSMTLIWRWDETPRFRTILGAAATTAAAILAKSPAAYLGLVLAYVVIRKRGPGAFRDVRLYAVALLAVLPPLAWYVWAGRFWTMYGLSLGVSNESHFISWAMLFPPRFLYGILKWETLGVFTPAGWLLALAALRSPRDRIERALVWYAAVLLFYLVTAGTSADSWSFYYHAISTGPACLLMGAGLVALAGGEVVPRRWDTLGRWERWLGAVLATGTVVALVAANGILIRRRDAQPDYLNMRRCALLFVRYVPETGLLVSNGGAMVDEYGRPVAYNESMIFAWMDRRGFNYGREELSPETLERIAARGGRYWMVQGGELQRDGLKHVAEERYRLLAECEFGYSLYDLAAGARS